MLAMASFDGLVRLWSVVNRSCIRVFSRHRDSLHSLASGTVWDVRDGTEVKSFKGKGDMFEAAWNAEET